LTLHLNWPAASVFIGLFLGVSLLGFWAARWKKGDLDDLHEWGLGGRRFGAWISWFLIGGDLYTAYTVIAVPAVVYAIGAYGFFAIPYTILIYPLLYFVFPRLWNISQRNNYITGSDFVGARYGNKALETAIAFTGILATMPYIALQLVGMEKVIGALGFEGQGLYQHLPLSLAFLILALFTYKSGLRAPATIAFVKDILIYIVVIAAILIIPAKLGGYQAIFDSANVVFEAKVAASNGQLAAGLLLAPVQIAPFITLALGSAMALFMYPHALTGILSASSSQAIRKNAIALPAYSMTLLLIGLLGYMAHAAGIKVSDPQDAVPQLFLKMFPAWFAGVAFAAIAIGALVPAAVMSIGSANTFTRNIYKPLINPALGPREEAMLAKFMSLIVKLGALVVILFMPTKFALDLQLLGGIWMIEIFPAVIFGLFTRWFSGTALLAGWAIGMGLGTWLSWGTSAWTPVHVLPGTNLSVYNGIIALFANIFVATVLSAVLPNRVPDRTKMSDYADLAADQFPV
jgi:SSS family solute:Na+ symporter